MALCSCGDTNTVEPDPTPTPEPTPEPEPVDVNMSVFYNGTKTMMKFTEDGGVDLPYQGADGIVYKAGDFKPVWRQMQENLNFTINDLTPASGTAIKSVFTDFVTTGYKVDGTLVNILQGNADQINEEGTNGNLVDLSKYLDQMPNLKAFLDENPVVKKAISGSNGEIYYAPYFDGYDDIERMLMLRADWVRNLLDGDLPSNLDTAKTVGKNYTAYYEESCDTSIKVVKADKSGTESVTKKHSANIITTQNNLSSMNGQNLVKALRDYIDTTYNGYYGTSRSELFLGVNAAYDIDELVALFRCVYTNPGYLTGDASNEITCFFPREKTNDRTTDLWRFMQFFGIRGVESRNNWFYVGEDGKLHDPRGEENFRDVLMKLRELYQDKLILQDFTEDNATSGGKGKYRSDLLQGNLGFSTYDYNQTTTIFNDDSKCSAIDGFLFVSVLPAVAKWRSGSDVYSHYTESWRTVKQQGWCITEETVENSTVFDKCLEIFDYQFSEEGNQLMSYGPAGYVKTDDNGNVVTMDYQGKQVPVLSDTTKEQLKDLTSGNYTNYYRYYVGATYPIGYVKEQGMEYQTVSAKAVEYLDNINAAIELGVLEHVNHKDDNTDHLFDIIPASFAFTEQENNSISTEFTELTSVVSTSKGETNVFIDIVEKGFGTYSDYDFSYANFCKTFNDTLNLESWVKLYQGAYDRMGL